MDFYVYILLFLTDLAVNAKSCVNSNLVIHIISIAKLCTRTVRHLCQTVGFVISVVDGMGSSLP